MKIKKILTLSKINDNKIPYLSPKKLNYKSFEKTLENNNKKMSYFNYRKKLFQKCNSQILENKEICPILSNRNKNNKKYPRINRSLNKRSLCETPIKIKKKIKNIQILFDSNKEKNKSINNSINKNNSKIINLDNNEENNNLINKIFEITLNTPIKNNKALSINNSVNNIFKKNEEKSKYFLPSRFSKFYHYSKNRNISAKKIYEHYILDEIKQNVKPIDNFTKFIETKDFQTKLNKLYCIDNLYINNINEIKSNKSIAFKEDFDIQDYQKILLGMVKKRIDHDSLFFLKQNFKSFNEKLFRGYEIHKGRYTKLADKIRNFAPIYLINKLRQLDDEKIKEKAKYFRVRLKKPKEVDTFYEFEYYIKNKFVPNLDFLK